MSKKSSSAPSQISNPFSVGDGGGDFENKIQSLFVVLMLAGGSAPGLPGSRIHKIRFQARHFGFETDDNVVYVRDERRNSEAKLLVQVRHKISIAASDAAFEKALAAAWRDFHNPAVFNQSTDLIELVTGPLSSSDTDAGRVLFELGASAGNYSDYFDLVRKSRVVSDVARQKFEAMLDIIKRAGGNRDDERDIWEFMKHFRIIGSDLDIRTGLNESLIQALIIRVNPVESRKIWARIQQEVKEANKTAGTLRPETMAHDIRDAFVVNQGKEIPAYLDDGKTRQVRRESILATASSDVALAMLLGSWDESNEDDRFAAETISAQSYGDWIENLREVVLQDDSPVIQKNNKWKIPNRAQAWSDFGPRIFDEHLGRFKELAVRILQEADPKFELPKEEHIYARIRGKIRKHSARLREGIAETVAMLGSLPEPLSSCTTGVPRKVATLIVRDLLRSDDWEVWTSLNDELPLLAEASPDEFLDAVNRIISTDNARVVKKIFEQEGGAIGGWNYITGILRGLETLAWDPDHLGRSILTLARLAEIDPGGQWANRPAESITTILLPWLPQTSADVERRIRTVASLLKQSPEVGWKVLMNMLPGSSQVSMGTRKPAFRRYIPEDLLKKLSIEKPQIPQQEYAHQIIEYAKLASGEARRDLTKLKELLQHTERLTKEAFLQVVEHLRSAEVVGMPEEQRVDLWEAVTSEVAEHRKFADAKWALPKDAVDKLSEAAERLKPKSPMLVHRRLFGSHEAELYETKGDYENQRRQVEDLRSNAVKDILEAGGKKALLDFAQTVSMYVEVGVAAAKDPKQSLDRFFLPLRLGHKDNKIKNLTYGFVVERFRMQGWNWFDSLQTKRWSRKKLALLLSYLPFDQATWRRVKRLLGQDEILYWQIVDVHPYTKKTNLQFGVNKLLKYGRPRAALECINWMLYERQSPKYASVYRTLRILPTSSEAVGQTDGHHVTEVIKWLQNQQNVDRKVLAEIEWIYLDLLDHHFGSRPVTLERRLADESTFFCEALRIVFRSRSDDGPEEKITEERKNLATRVYRLLRNWNIVPGTREDGSFDAAKLKKWVAEVRKSCQISGHIEIANDQIGKVLAHSPADPNGLWIHQSVAGLLDEDGMDDLRSGYTVERFNMRGTFWGSGGEGERVLATEYREKADAVEAAGFIRFADSLRRLAQSYENDAERESKRDRLDD